MTWYNEIDPFAAQWLRNLADAGHIAAGTVDERPVETLRPDDIAGKRAHFFAGIGGWDLALQLAGWPAGKPVWTGSCPCQPFSVAGKQAGGDDPRHLWPAWFRLIRECRPDTIFGEQVAGAIGHGWLDGVFADLESEGYACGAIVLGAHSVGAPHIRQRLFWVAESEHAQRRPFSVSGQDGCNGADVGRPEAHSELGTRGEVLGLAHTQQRAAERHGYDMAGASGGMQTAPSERQRIRPDAGDGGDIGGMEYAAGSRRTAAGSGHPLDTGPEPIARCSDDGWLGDSDNARSQGWDGGIVRERAGERAAGPAGTWSDSYWLSCTDGRARRVPAQPALFPLADGLPGRVGLLRGAGNSIVPQVAAAFVRAYMETTA